MSLAEEIKSTILEAIPDAKVYVADPDGEHFEAIVISESFEGMPLVRQHQKVMNALKEQFATTVHALGLRTFSPEKWEAQKSNFPTLSE